MGGWGKTFFDENRQKSVTHNRQKSMTHLIVRFISKTITGRSDIKENNIWNIRKRNPKSIKVDAILVAWPLAATRKGTRNLRTNAKQRPETYEKEWMFVTKMKAKREMDKPINLKNKDRQKAPKTKTERHCTNSRGWRYALRLVNNSKYRCRCCVALRAGNQSATSIVTRRSKIIRWAPWSGC